MIFKGRGSFYERWRGFGQIFSRNSVLGLPCVGVMGKTVARTAGDARFHSSVARLRGY